MRSTVLAVARIVKRMADGLYARQLNLCQVPVSRQTGQVRPSTHMDGYRVNQAVADRNPPRRFIRGSPSCLGTGLLLKV
jgi:hypothetical protein